MAILTRLARALRGERAAADAEPPPGTPAPAAAATPAERLDTTVQEAHFFVASTVSADRRFAGACREADSSPGGEGGTLVDVYLLDMTAGTSFIEREAFALPPGYPVAEVGIVVTSDTNSVELVVLGDALAELYRVQQSLPLEPAERNGRADSAEAPDPA